MACSYFAGILARWSERTESTQVPANYSEATMYMCLCACAAMSTSCVCVRMYMHAFCVGRQVDR